MLAGIINERDNHYYIHLEEANNKRYFKNGQEDFRLFFQNNRVSAICYSSEGRYF